MTGRVIPGVYWSAVCPACGRTVGISHDQPDLDRPVPCVCGGLAGYTWRLAEPDPRTSTPAPQEDRTHAHAREGLGLVLDRPLVVLDLETTGVDTREARIVEFCFLKLWPDGRRETYSERLNPGIPIPPEATAIHGITDYDVSGCSRFVELATCVLEVLDGCDLAGFNIRSYDLKVLLAELARCGLTLDLAGLRLVDALSIYHRREPRNLTAAVRLYLGRDHAEAHGALGDVRATLEVLAAQLERYPDLPKTVAELHEMFAPEGALDLEGRFRRGPDGEARFTFGKYVGESLALIARDKPDYLLDVGPGLSTRYESDHSGGPLNIFPPDTTIRTLGLWPSIVAHLEARGIATVGQLASLTRTELLVNGFGVSRLRLVEEALAIVGYSLAENPAYANSHDEVMEILREKHDPGRQNRQYQYRSTPP